MVSLRMPMYEMGISLLVTWQAHALSNSGTDGSIRQLPRRQVLSSGESVDACSGNIAKHHHSVLAAEYFEQNGLPLCEACQRRDGRRAAALIKPLQTMEQALVQCALCDTHGFLRTAKRGLDEVETSRSRLAKHGGLDFSESLARPERWGESLELFTRNGGSKEDGQMIMKRSVRSGEYAMCVRYKAVTIGVDTDKWQLLVKAPNQRLLRHVSILLALRDQLVSPSGAMTSTLLPHLTGLRGVILTRETVGRAPLLSGLLDDSFIEQSLALAARDATLSVFKFGTVAEFYDHMTHLSEITTPGMPVDRPPQSLKIARKQTRPLKSQRTRRAR